MEISSLLSNHPAVNNKQPRVTKPPSKAPLFGTNGGPSHRKTLRDGFKVTKPRPLDNLQKAAVSSDGAMDVMNPVSPNTLRQSAATPPKKVSFELLLDETTRSRARIPMRVVINPHDTTDSIIATVKNWYGIYEGHGVSFEDQQGNTLIARYENLVHDMVIHVRIIPSQLLPPAGPPPPASPQQAHTPQRYGAAVQDQPRPAALQALFQMIPPNPLPEHSPPNGRYSVAPPASRKSLSPPMDTRNRAISQQKRGSRSETKSGASSNHDGHHDDTAQANSDSDGGQSSVTGSRKAKSEQCVRADISLENVLQDGRRNRPKFDSSVRIPERPTMTFFTRSIQKNPSQADSCSRNCPSSSLPRSL